MRQLSLFDISSSDTKGVRHDLRFRDVLSILGVEYGTGWPDRFGLAIREWLRDHGHALIRTLSLFTGGGGLDIGFADAGFHSLEMVEIEKKYVETLRINCAPHKIFSGARQLCQDIRDYIPAPELQVDFIIGGPPCQTFSAAGRRAAGVLGTTDQRGTLFEEYVRLLRALRPKGFLFENVYGLMGAQEGEAWEQIKAAFRSTGYSIQYRILDSADYGVPQHRERIFVVGVQEGEYLFPRPTHGPDSQDGEPYFTAGAAVMGADVSDAVHGLGGQYGHLLQNIPPGLNYSFYTEKMGHPRPVFGWRSKFSDFLYKADPDAPVRTIKAQGGQYTGPFSWENRPLTVAEFKRLQTIPDSYELAGLRQACIEQIGNSVPPQMARILALSVLDQVFGVSLPFEMAYLPHYQELGFRQRKRHKTHDYSRKARQAIDLLPSTHISGMGVADATNDQIIRYLTDQFGWLTTKRGRCSAMQIHYEFYPSQWVVHAQNVENEGSFQSSYEIDVVPSTSKKWALPVDSVKLIGGDFSLHTFTALWKAFEEKTVELVGVADLVQLNGYYQYLPVIRAKMTFIATPDDNIWQLLWAVVQGIGVARQMNTEEFQHLFHLNIQDILPSFERLRSVGYEVRNHNTNPQIKVGDYLVPYAFPTLTPRSVQLRKKLRPAHG